MIRIPSALQRRSNLYPHYSFGNVEIVKILVTAVCSKVKNLSLILQPGLSRTETALILLMTIPLRLHAAFSQSGLCLWLGSMLCLHLTAFRLDTTLFAINLKMLPKYTQQMDNPWSPHREVNPMLTISLCPKEFINRVFQIKIH